MKSSDISLWKSKKLLQSVQEYSISISLTSARGGFLSRRSVKLLPGMDTFLVWYKPSMSSILHIFSVSRKYVRRTEKMVNGSHAIRSLAWLIDLIKGDMQSKGVVLTAKSVLDWSFRFLLGLMECEGVDHAMDVSTLGKSWLWSGGMESTIWSSWMY